MILTNFKIAYRNLLRNKIFSFINISGLAIGMTCTILLLTWINHELNYNRFHKNSKQIYQVANWMTYNSDKTASSYIPHVLIPALKDAYPEINLGSNFRSSGKNTLLDYQGNKKYVSIQYAGTDFFQIFQFPFLQGDPNKCLHNIYSIVITKTEADKLFGKDDPIGKTIILNNKQAYTVTAIIEDIPDNSSIKFTYLLPYENLKRSMPYFNNWTSHNTNGYVTISENTNVNELNKKIAHFYKKYAGEDCQNEVFLYPLVKRHLYNLDDTPSNIQKVRMFLYIAIFILIIACFNFMNLSTARSGKRAKEIGLKKTVGSSYIQLIKQFLGESILLTLIAVNFALLLTNLFLPEFNLLIQSKLTIDYRNTNFWIIIVGIIAFTGIIAGAYPAFYLSSFNPVKVLKGTFISGKRSKQFRKLLVISQFVITSTLLACTLTIATQFIYMTNVELGMSKENIISIRLNEQLRSNIESIKNELLQKSHIQTVSLSKHLPYSVYQYGWGEQWEGKDPEYQAYVSYPYVDANFIDLFEIEMAEGRFFNKNNPKADYNCAIVNEKFAKIISKESVIDKVIHTGMNEDLRIVGVVKDYYSRPVTQELQPILIRLCKYPNFLFVKYHKGNAEETNAYVQKVCSKYSPDYPLLSEFMENDYNQLFNNEKSTLKILFYTSSLAIIISCLGLFGLVSFIAEEKTKEIGIRKVLGANQQQLLFIFSKDFIVWILISTLISCPICYYIMQKWFENYPNRIDFPFWIFIVVFLQLIIIAIVTIAHRSYQTTHKNPIESLQYE